MSFGGPGCDAGECSLFWRLQGGSRTTVRGQRRVLEAVCPSASSSMALLHELITSFKDSRGSHARHFCDSYGLLKARVCRVGLSEGGLG